MNAVDAGDLLYELRGRVAWVTFKPSGRSQRDDVRHVRTLLDLCERIDKDPDVRVVVVRGAGDKSFAAGTDIRQFLSFETRDDALGYEARIGRVLRRLNAVTKPTIAMVQGDAVGGGLFLSLACDLRFAAEHARFVRGARKRGNGTEPSASVLASKVGRCVRARSAPRALVNAAEGDNHRPRDEVYLRGRRRA